MMASLRVRLTAGIIGGMLLLLLVSSLILHTTIRRALLEQFDTMVASTARMLAASVEQDANEIELASSIQQMPEFRDSRHATYYQIWRDDGTIAAKSPMLHAENLVRFGEALDSPVFAELQGRDGRPLRTVGLRFIPQASDSDEERPPQQTNSAALSLTVARDATELYGQLHFLRWLFLSVSAAAGALSFLVATIVVRYSLVPLNSIALQIGGIQPDDLTVRVEAQHVPTEIAPIRERLNDLLSRIEASFNRERRFTADVAHELRTPLAGIRSTIEVTLARTRDKDEYQAVLSDCLEIVQSMQAMVNSLLMLARLDTRQIRFRHEQVQLADLAGSCWRPFSEKAADREITFDNRIPGDMACDSDPDSLSMVLSNLFDNAVEYGNRGGRIWTTACQVNDSVKITVANTGCSLTDEQCRHVFDCLWRADSSRSETGVHCGLGLALVQKIVVALGGRCIAYVGQGGVFTVELTLPLAKAGVAGGAERHRPHD
jgi:two-component system heavy metal sensor histidine kinase CusS